MNHNAPLPPLSPRPLRHLSEVHRRVMTAAQLRSHGVATAETNEQCRPGGPWQQILPGVLLLHPGPPTSEERLHAVLMYAARERSTGVPSQPNAGEGHAAPAYAEAMITGLAALTLHGFSATPPLTALDTIDVLVPRHATAPLDGLRPRRAHRRAPHPPAGDGPPGGAGPPRAGRRGGRTDGRGRRTPAADRSGARPGTANRPRWYGS